MSHNVHLHVCVRACARVCVIKENTHPFQDFHYLISHTLLIYFSDFNYFCHVGPFLYIFMCK